MASLGEFEQDLLRERVRSGMAAARKRGVVFGRRQDYCGKSQYAFATQKQRAVMERPTVREAGQRASGSCL
jgi:DNA invertase Pin-like site-specific DNA recombinase